MAGRPPTAHACSTDDTLVDALDALLRTHPEKQQLRVVAALLYRVGDRNGITAGKLNGCGISEFLVSEKLNLHASTAMHGADARTAAGGTVELKNSQVYLKGKYRTNFSYDMTPPIAGVTVDQYLATTRGEWAQKANSHHVLAVLRNHDVVKTYRIEAAFMTDYLVNWLRWHCEKKTLHTKHALNLGSHPCKSCGEYRRVARLVRLSTDYVPTEWSRTRWATEFTKKVASNCTSHAATAGSTD